MKRLITFVCLIVVVILGYFLISNGLEKGSLKIASYTEIEQQSAILTKKVASYNTKNKEEYDTALTSLNDSIKSYKNAKANYEGIVEELADVLNKDASGNAQEEVLEEYIYTDKEKYKVDFLLVTLGDYGEKEGVDVIYQLTTSSTFDPNSTTLGYFLSDLRFSVTGQYMDVANFISDLENDDKLSWEIKDFAMVNGSSNGYVGVTASFNVRDVPIDSESYLNSTAGNDVTYPSGTQTTPENNNTPTNGTNPSTTPQQTTNNQSPAGSNTTANTTTNTTTDTTNTANTNTTSNTTQTGSVN